MAIDETAAMVLDTGSKLFEKWEATPPDAAGAGDKAWEQIEELGLHRLMWPEEREGYGLSPDVALAVIRLSGRCSLATPLADTLVAGWIAGHSGLPLADGPVALAFADELSVVPSAGRLRVRGVARDIAWGMRCATLLIGEADGRAVAIMIPNGSAAILAQRDDVAGQLRVSLKWNIDVASDSLAALPSGLTVRHCRALGAAARAAQIAGAAERIRDMTVVYVRDRVQFGKPLAALQVVQQSLALLASQSAAAAASLGRAASAFGCEPGGWEHAAIAKIRVGEAGNIVASIAHQLHGAIGWTKEYRLHRFTRAIWAWRDDFGSEIAWARDFGNSLIERGADGLWPKLAR
jgi:alkylation response protein AidB-like acyl-CoA dehydrogenase